MKRIGLFLLVLALVLLCVPAYATTTNGLGETVTRSGELAAFLDGSGNIYISGLNQPVNTAKADGLISIDPYRIIFFAKADAASGIPAGRLYELRLNSADSANPFTESAITDDAYAACLDADDIYYISRSDRTRLMRHDLTTGLASIAFTADEALQSSYSETLTKIAQAVIFE